MPNNAIGSLGSGCERDFPLNPTERLPILDRYVPNRNHEITRAKTRLASRARLAGNPHDRGKAAMTNAQPATIDDGTESIARRLRPNRNRCRKRLTVALKFKIDGHPFASLSNGKNDLVPPLHDIAVE